MIMAVSTVLMESVRVVKSATCGRSLVFNSKSPPGKCILEELEPYAYTLIDNKRGLYCDFCLKQCSTLKKCASCKYVRYCNRSCQIGDRKRCHKQDCKDLKRMHPKVPGDFVQLLSQIIRKQRKSAPCTQDGEDCFPTSVDQLESHLSDTIKNHSGTVLFLLQLFVGGDVLADQTSVLNMYGATKCNNLSILDNDLNCIASGIYLRASMANHSCDPNCVVVFDGRKLQLRTVKDVKEGEECTIGYVDLMNPTKERQAELEKMFSFTCKCVKCVEETNPNDGLDEELRGLKTSWKKIQDAMESQDWDKVLQLCEPYLKPTDSSSSLPANHHLVVRLRQSAIKACELLKAWPGKIVEMRQLDIESLRYHYGPFSAILGTHLLYMGNTLLEMGRLQEARKYLTEAESVLEVTHGPQHSLMASVKKLLFKCR